MIFGVLSARKILPRLKIKNMPAVEVEHRKNKRFKRKSNKIGQKLINRFWLMENTIFFIVKSYKSFFCFIFVMCFRSLKKIALNFFFWSVSALCASSLGSLTLLWRGEYGRSSATPPALQVFHVYTVHRCGLTRFARLLYRQYLLQNFETS